MGKNSTLVSSQRVPVSPDIVRRLDNNVSAAYYYAQLLYYDQYEEKTDGWFAKSSREIEHDLGIGRRRQEHSRKLLERVGWIKTTPVRGGKRPLVLFRILIKSM